MGNFLRGDGEGKLFCEICGFWIELNKMVSIVFGI